MRFAGPPRLRDDLVIRPEGGAARVFTPTGEALVLDEGQWTILQEVDGARPLAEIAARVSERFEEEVTPEALEALFGELRARGVFTVLSGGVQEPARFRRRCPALARRLRRRGLLDPSRDPELSRALERGDPEAVIRSAAALAGPGADARARQIASEVEAAFSVPPWAPELSFGRVTFPLLRHPRHLEALHRALRPLFTLPGAAALAAFVASAAWPLSRWTPPAVREVLTPGALALSWLAAALAVVVHEYAHALTCRHFGGRVPSLGVGLLFGLPMAYSDLTASHAFPERWKRIAVLLAGSAGTAAVLAAAAWCAYLAPPGGVLAGAMAVTLTWQALFGLVVNLLPFVKLDGYFILAELLSIDHLWDRSFRVLRARLAGRPPEDERWRALLAYALCTVLFLAAAAALCATLIARGLRSAAG